MGREPRDKEREQRKVLDGVKSSVGSCLLGH